MVGIASDNDLLTVPEAATVLKVSPVTVSRWLRQGRLPAYRLGPRAVRIRRSDLTAVFSPARARPAAPTGAAGSDGAGAPPVAAAQPGPGRDASAFDARLAARTAAAAQRGQIRTRRKGSPLSPLEGDRNRGKRS